MRGPQVLIALMAVAWIMTTSLASNGPAGLNSASSAPETWSPEVPLLDLGRPSFDAALAPGGWGAEASPEHWLTRPATSKFVVTYYDFPPDARAAFEYAKAIWERLVTSSAEVYISAYWERLDGSLLATVQTRSFVKDQELDKGLPVADVLYPAALAGAIRGKRIDNAADMRVRMNSSAAWYYGTDTEVPPRQTDLVTVALHEIGQGLGIASGFDIRNGVVTTRPSMSLLTIFDQFVVSGDGRRLAGLFAAKSPVVLGLLTGGNVYFDGPAAVVAAGGKGPRLYAAAQWDTSNISHLDFNTYFAPDDNALMAPFTSRGWAIHDPGPIGLAILKDLGWTVSGLGAPARLKLNTLASLAWDGEDFPIQPRVTVHDPIGAPVPGQNEIEVTLGLWGGDTFTGAGCSGTPLKALVNSVAAYTGCYFEGFGSAFATVRADGLARGSSNVFVVLGKNRAFIPGITYDR